MAILQFPIAEKEGAVRNFIAVHMQQYPFIFSNERKYRLRRHLVFWVFWWVFFGILYSYTAKVTLLPNLMRLPISMMDSFFFIFPHMFLSYALMYYVIPSCVFRGRYFRASYLVLGLFFVTACFSALIGTYLLPYLRHEIFSLAWESPTNTSYLMSLLAGLRGAITVGGIAAAIKLMKYWYLKEQRNLQLQKENISAELQLLKAQVHPHFLFNTLNNIYAHTQNNSPVASQMITGLSDLLRYMLYEGSQPLVPLSKELKMIRDYMSLEQIRYGNKLELFIDLPRDTKGLQIAPLLLLPLVENCFKHGTSHVLEQPWVNLQIFIRDKQLQLKLLNGKLNRPPGPAIPSGIGISNVRKRLAFIYPGKHELTITEEEEVFIVNMKVELDYSKEEHAKIKQPVPVHA